MNNRWRQFKKMRHISEGERWELISDFEPLNVRKCPCCGHKLQTARWCDDGPYGYQEVERLERCKPCNYQIHEAYGHTIVTIGQYGDEYRYNKSYSAVKRIHKWLDSQVKVERTKRKQHRRKWWNRKRA